MIAEHDFEVYSEGGYVWNAEAAKWEAPPGAREKGLPAVGAAISTAHPSAEVLTYRYDLKDGRGSQHWRPGLPNPKDLFDHIAAGKPLEAWNTAYERWVWKNICRPKYGWPEMPEQVMRCAMAKARAHALPGKLELAGEVTRAAVQKDKEGKRLLDKFSKPRNPTKGDPRWRILPVWSPDGSDALARYREMGLDPAKLPRNWVADDHADTLLLDRYCARDIEAEEAVSSRCPEIEGEEFEFWQADQRINERGVKVDQRGVQDCIAVIQQAHGRYNAELLALTGIDAASKIQQLQGWLRGRGVHMESLDEESVAAALAWVNIDPVARRVLEIRALVGSASVKKVFAMANTIAPDGRVHDLFSYHAARTGRATGNGAQPTNMPNSGPEMRRCGLWIEGKFIEDSGCKRHFRPCRLSCPWCGRADVVARKNVEWSFSAAEDCREVIGTRSLAIVEDVCGNAMSVVSGVLRGLFVADDGYDLISSDYSSIEAVVLAMLANEQWRIDVFRTHGKIYEASAAQMFNVPLDEILAHKQRTGENHPLRKLGKVAELALGYAGWVGAAKNFEMPGTDDEIKDNIKKWRRASPAVVEFWGGQSRGYFSDRYPELYGVEGMAIMALRNPGQWYEVMRLDHTGSGVSYCAVGDTLYCRLPSGRLLTYHNCILSPSTRPYAADWELSISFEGYNTNPLNGPVGWIRMNTYAGKLVENCIAEGTEVMTNRGWVPIEAVLETDLIWDGVEFVGHSGRIFKSVQTCQQIDGVWMTPDHEVLTNEGWRPASSIPEPLRPDLWLVDGHATERRPKWPLSNVALPLFLRRVGGESRGRHHEGPAGREAVKLRMCHPITDRPEEHEARHEQASRLRSLAVNERSLPAPDASSVAQLRRAGDSGVRKVARVIRELLGRHGADVCARPGDRPGRQRRGLQPGKLPVGGVSGPVQQPEGEHSDQYSRRSIDSGASVSDVRHRGDHTLVSHRPGLARGSATGSPELRQQRVFDILNCGPRHRFVVRGASGPFIVHNCIQAVARDILRHAIVNLERAGYRVVLHVYDEIVAETQKLLGSIEEFEAIMMKMPAFAAGWPIKAAGGWRGRRYRKG